MPDGEVVLLRIPLPDRDEMEYREFSEADVVRAAGAAGVAAPEVVWSNSDPPFQIHSYVEGINVNQLYPRGEELPPTFIPAVLETIRRLRNVERHALNRVGGPESTGAFLADLIARQQRVFDQCRQLLPAVYEWLGLADDPFDPMKIYPTRLSSRRLQLCHGDIERRNCLVEGTRVVFLDWELARWADPLWELSTHIVRTQYLPGELDRFLQLAREALPVDAIYGLESDFEYYRQFEIMRSVVNDTRRYVQGLMGVTVADPRWDQLARELEWKYSLGAEVTGMRSADAPSIVSMLSFAVDSMPRS